jgi:hypothetical protein
MEDVVGRFDHTVEVMDQLLDHVTAISFLVLDYAEKNKIPIEGNLSFHLTRICRLLNEVTHPVDTRLMDRVLNNVTKSKQNLDSSWGHSCPSRDDTNSPRSSQQACLEARK